MLRVDKESVALAGRQAGYQATMPSDYHCYQVNVVRRWTSSVCDKARNALDYNFHRHHLRSALFVVFSCRVVALGGIVVRGWVKSQQRVEAEEKSIALNPLVRSFVL